MFRRLLEVVSKEPVMDKELWLNLILRIVSRQIPMVTFMLEIIVQSGKSMQQVWNRNENGINEEFNKKTQLIKK